MNFGKAPLRASLSGCAGRTQARGEAMHDDDTGFRCVAAPAQSIPRKT